MESFFDLQASSSSIGEYKVGNQIEDQKMKLLQAHSIYLPDWLILPDQEKHDISDEFPEAQDYQYKVKIAQAKLETELRVTQKNRVKYLDC